MNPILLAAALAIWASGGADAACPFASQFRTLNGHCNCLNNPVGGMIGTAYKDRGCKQRNVLTNTFHTGRPNPRLISNVIFNQDEEILDERGLTNMAMQFGQFVDHDMTGTKVKMSDRADIPIHGSHEYQMKMRPGQKIMFERAEGHEKDQVLNNITHWIDASVVYGSEEYKLAGLVVPGTAKLKLGEHHYIEHDHTYWKKLPVAGDKRANVVPGLSALQSLFVREHNRLVDIIEKDGVSNEPEEVFHLARSILDAEIQRITWEEYLPSMLGVRLEEGEYDSSKLGITRLFAGAIFRMAHSAIPNRYDRYDDTKFDSAKKEYTPHPAGPVNITKASGYFDDDATYAETGNKIEPILIGLFTQPMEKQDAKVLDGMRNHLFENYMIHQGPQYTPAMDIVAVDIQRGRDFGLEDYRTVRAHLTGDVLTSFDQITSDKLLISKMRALYDNNLANVDLFVGMMAEDHLPNASVGPTVMQGLAYEFCNVQRSDRFWFRGRLNKQIAKKCQPGKEDSKNLCDLRKAILEGRWGLSDVIKANTNLPYVPPNVFVRPGFEKFHASYPPMKCPDLHFNATVPPYDPFKDHVAPITDVDGKTPLFGSAAVRRLMTLEGFKVEILQEFIRKNKYELDT